MYTEINLKLYPGYIKLISDMNGSVELILH